uniref:Uncharacterized protein n=1 Tax=Oryza sativa subsp. japonica TaxID=39947 RepID=Q2R395_ORYSJ|nr:hypothetical protein LOC_Os11g32710 [Oryza sativa Japonica Group]
MAATGGCGVGGLRERRMRVRSVIGGCARKGERRTRNDEKENGEEKFMACDANTDACKYLYK